VTVISVTAEQDSRGYWSPSINTVVSNSLTFTGSLDTLVWTPVLPQGWIVTAVDAGGNGLATVQDGVIVFTEPPTASPAQFSYTLTVPGDQAVSNAIAATVTVNGATLDVPEIAVYRYHSADYRSDLTGGQTGQFRKIDSTEINRVLAYWRKGYKPDPLGYDGFSASADYHGTETTHHSSDLNKDWAISNDELNYTLAYWRSDGYHVDLTKPDGYAAERAGAGPRPLSFGPAIRTVSVTAAPAGYNPGETVQLTYTLNLAAGDTLHTLQWKPDLPQGWTVERVSGDGSPELVRGEVTCLKQVLPTDTATITLTVRVPLTESRTVTPTAASRFKLATADAFVTLAAEGVTLAPIDADGNGLADAWERAYAGAAGTLDPNADLDGDGHTNDQEYRAGTIPTDANSILKLLDIQPRTGGSPTVLANGPVPAGSVSITWASVPGHRYIVLRTASLARPFEPIATDIEADPSGRNLYIDGPAETGGARFYRVLLQD
ncbi:MAG: hypothetical protein LBW77_02860, partial [Verrucomicrobiota bacterium]|nr:hypothetical protein [Verrucomicrobiota bacterium]